MRETGLSASGLAVWRIVEVSRGVTSVSVTGVRAVSETVLFGVGEGCGAMSSEAEGAGWVRAVFAQFPRRCGRQPRQGCPLLMHEQFWQRPVRLQVENSNYRP